MKYKNIKKILETKDVVIFTSKAEYTIYFEKKNASNEDIKRLHAFFDKQNITWRKSILQVLSKNKIEIEIIESYITLHFD